MIKIAKTANSTITVTNETDNITFIILGKDCEVRVISLKNIYDASIDSGIRTLMIYNKYNSMIIATVDTTTLDPASDNYSSNMDTYASNLTTSVLYV